MQRRATRAVSGRELVSLIGEGRLTRRTFDAWYEQRRPRALGIVIAMRDTPPARGLRRRRKH